MADVVYTLSQPVPGPRLVVVGTRILAGGLAMSRRHLPLRLGPLRYIFAGTLLLLCDF
jgi:hypothetical protein